MTAMTADTEAVSGLKDRRFPLPAIAASLVLHALLLVLFLFRTQESEGPVSVLPVELVTVAEQTIEGAPAAQGGERQTTIRQRPPASPRVQANPNPPSRVAPSRVPEPANDNPAPERDALQVKLEELAKLTQPDTDTGLLQGRTAGSAGPGGSGRGLVQAYSVKDFLRAQVERRWVLNLDSLAGRNPAVSIHVVLEKDGTVAKAEIVNAAGGTNDEVYRYVAISARNAVILSSPFTLPPGSYEQVKDIVLELNPANMVR